MSRYDWGRTHPGIERLERAVTDRRDVVVKHPLYANLDTHEALVTFMGRQECADTVNDALAARARLWDGILAAIKEGRPA